MNWVLRPSDARRNNMDTMDAGVSVMETTLESCWSSRCFATLCQREHLTPLSIASLGDRESAHWEDLEKMQRHSEGHEKHSAAVVSVRSTSCSLPLASVSTNKWRYAGKVDPWDLMTRKVRWTFLP